MNGNYTKLMDIDVPYNIDTLRFEMVAIYEEETDKEVIRHKVVVPLPLAECPTVHIDASIFESADVSVDLGFGMLEGANIESRVIKVKEKEMTIEEIEKALGYKVKIVGGKNND